MRKLILSMQTSLDGYVEGKNGDMSWMQPDDDETWGDLFGILKIKLTCFCWAAACGRNIATTGKKRLPSRRSFRRHEVEYAKLAEKTPHIVFSKTLKESGWENTTINSGDLETEIKKIKASEGKDIQIVGGADFAASLLDTGLVDEIRVLVNPAIVAGGKSFFHQIKNRHSLELTSVRQLSSQVVVLVYNQLDTNSAENQNPVKRRAENNKAA
jgi:dihydrofolate reductase